MANVQRNRGTWRSAAARGVVWLGVWASLFVAGCTVGPEYTRPEMDMPDTWTQSRTEGATEHGDPNEQVRWWAGLNDPVLDSLMEQALQANRDLREAYFRIQESRANRVYAAGGRWPQVDAGASYTRSRSSENGPAGGSGQSMEEKGLYSAGFDAAWEIDLFGGIRRSVESAQAALEAAVDDYHGVQITLQGEVASTYVELRTIQLRIRYAEDNLRVQQRTLELTRSLFAAGRVSELDVKRAESASANTEAQVPPLKVAEIQAINRLAVLLGGFPGTLSEDLATPGLIPQLSELWAVGLPADLLRRRPDIRQAEHQLAAQVAQIGVAQADRYPSFSLSGTFDLQARNASDWGSWASRAYSFGPNLRWNVFNGNRVTSTIKMREAVAEQARVRYEQTVLTAVEEVENALAAHAQEQDRNAALERAAAASEQSVTLVQTLYESGLTDFQDVLDVQRTLFDQQDNLAGSRGQMVQDAIRLYKALGGGWAAPQDVSQDAPHGASR